MTVNPNFILLLFINACVAREIDVDATTTGETSSDSSSDADASTACDSCTRDSLIFISSELYQGFALGGLDGADARCRGLASAAGLARAQTFKAWLSTPEMPASARLVHSPGRYILVDGTEVAADWAGLTSGRLAAAITIDELGGPQETRVWTGTAADGSAYLGSEFCNNWDDTTGFILYGGEGRSVVTDATWSFVDHADCGGLNHLYCVEQF